MSFKWSLAQFLELKWWKNYQRKLDENYISKKKKYWIDVLEKMEYNSGQASEMLDVGCGPSGVYVALEGVNLDAVDPLIEKYETNIDFFSRKKFPNVTFYNTPFEDFKTSKKYNTVFCLNAINHFRDLNQSIEKLYDCTQIEGELVIGIDGHRHKLLKYLFQFIHMDLLHPIQLDKADYLQLFVEKGFKPVKTVTYTKGHIFNYYLIKFVKK